MVSPTFAAVHFVLQVVHVADGTCRCAAPRFPAELGGAKALASLDASTGYEKDWR